MKRIFLLLWGLPVFAALHAQGGFGHFSIGVAQSTFGNLARDLSVPSLMGSASVKGSGTSIGGGGFGLVGKHLLLGGKGFAGAFGKSTGPNGTLQTGHGWGFFNVGYLKPIPSRWWGYFYGGFGGGGASAELTNQSGSTWEFGGFQIKNGEKGSVGTGGMGFDAGVGAFRFLPSPAGGFMVGIQAGYCSGIGTQFWKNGSKQANNLAAWRPQMAYITLCIGGGGGSGFSR
ncbi:MAG: hypothetical protein JNL57_11610 [Bacteroidetes bacterium]|nr:hypothetical protein [Bacteroidota bacterium]